MRAECQNVSAVREIHDRPSLILQRRVKRGDGAFFAIIIIFAQFDRRTAPRKYSTKRLKVRVQVAVK